MSKATQSYQFIFQLIADILSFKNNEAALRTQIQTTNIDWESFVRIASSHLVLTTVYSRFNQKKIFHILPEDLQTYLKELTTINRNRNVTLLEEIHDISTLLKNHKINHVFLKGSALLIGEYYQDNGERMIGDIDILVEDTQIKTVFNLLAKQGYLKSIGFNYENKGYRHLPRQVSEDKLAAIELHKTVLNDTYTHLIDSQFILATKKIINGIAIPNEDDLIRSTILSYQLNSHGYYFNSLHLKYVYDCLVLNLDSNKKLLKKLSQEKYSSKFIALTNIHFPEIDVFKLSYRTKMAKSHYLWTLDNYRIGNFIFKMKRAYKNTINRFQLVLLNKNYRKHIISNVLLNR